MSKIFNRSLKKGSELFRVGAVSVQAEEFSPVDGGVWKCYGTTVPTNGLAGFTKGCVFIKTNGSTGTTQYLNEGSLTSCDFNAIEAGTPIFSDGEAILDNNGNELEVFGVASSAVNEIKLSNAATGNAPSMAAQGGDTNVAVLLKGKGTGAVQLGQATSVGVTLMADQPILDSSANELVKFTKVASAVNEITISNNSTGLGPTLTASGETNVPVTLAGKGTGYVGLGQATTSDVRLVADQPIADSSGNELIKFVKTATAVNEITITNAAANGLPSIAASGGDTNITLALGGKGAGALYLASNIVRTQDAQAAKTTSTILTAAEIAAGLITVNQGAGGASALQLPLATDLDTGLAFTGADDAFEFSLINISTNAAEDASITTNTGWTLVGNMDVASNAAATDKSAGRFLARKTGAGAWTLYRLS